LPDDYVKVNNAFAAKLDVHRRVFPGGAQITTAIMPFMLIKLLRYKKGSLLLTARSSRPTSGVPPAVQVLLIWLIIIIR